MIAQRFATIASSPPVIPEAEPQARLSGTSRNESNLPRSRFRAPLACRSHRSDRDDGWGEAGFTLIEVLVSLILLTLVLALLAGGVRFARGTWEAAARLEEQTGSEMAEAFIAARLGEAMALYEQHSAGTVRVVFHGTAYALSFVAPAPNGPAGAALYRYALEVTPGAGPGRGTLIVKLAPFQAKQAETAAEWAVQQHMLLRNLKSVAFRYFGRSRLDAEPAWHTAWTRADATPNLVEMTVARDAGHGGPISLTVALRLQTVTR
jgi:general secretion pathway protein J